MTIMIYEKKRHFLGTVLFSDFRAKMYPVNSRKVLTAWKKLENLEVCNEDK